MRSSLALSGALIVAVLLAPWTVRAEDVPEKLLSANSALIMRVDLEKVTPDLLGAAVKKLVAEADVEMVNEMLAGYQPFHAQLTQAGASSLGAILGGDGPQPMPTIFIRVKPGSDAAKAGQALCNLLFGGRGDPSNGPQPKQTGEFVYLQLVPVSAPEQADATAQALAQTFATLQASPAALLIVPNERMREDMQPPEGKNAISEEQAISQITGPLAECKHIAITADLGDAPRVTTSVLMPNAAKAKALVDGHAKALKMLQELLAEQAAKRGANADPLHRATLPLFINMLKAIAPTQDGDKVMVNLEGDHLRTALNTAMDSMRTARMAARQVMSMSQMRQLSMAIMMYATEHQDAFPDNLDQLADYVGGAENLKKLLTHPVTKQYPGYVYYKPAAKMADVREPGKVIVVQELGADKQPDPKGAKAYADGHVDRALAEEQPGQ